MPEIVSSSDAQYARELVETICMEVGPGVPGSSQERARAGIIRQELESHVGAGNVIVEEFTLAAGAYVGAVPLGALLTLVAVLLNVSLERIAGVPPGVTATGALLFSILAPLPFILEFVLYREFIDPLFRKTTSVNVIGTLRKPGTREVKRLLILSGHHDSAPENTWLRLLGYGFYFAVATMALGSLTMLALSILQFTGVVTHSTAAMRLGTLGWAMLAYPIVPAIVFGIFYTRRAKNGGTVPGAADNLSACALAVALCRFLVQDPSCIPDDTEIRFISFGSEEAGLRGSRRYVERHLGELRRLDARLLNIETVAHPEIGILSSEQSGTVKNSPEMVKSATEAAERAGVPYRVRPGTLGIGGDAGPFSEAGLKATTLLPFKVPQQMVAFYHQKWDRPEILTIEPLLNVLKLALEWVRKGGEAEQTEQRSRAKSSRTDRVEEKL